MLKHCPLKRVSEVGFGSQEAWSKTKEENYECRKRERKVCLAREERMQRRQPEEERKIHNTACVCCAVSLDKKTLLKRKKKATQGRAAKG